MTIRASSHEFAMTMRLYMCCRYSWGGTDFLLIFEVCCQVWERCGKMAQCRMYCNTDSVDDRIRYSAECISFFAEKRYM